MQLGYYGPANVLPAVPVPTPLSQQQTYSRGGES